MEGLTSQFFYGKGFSNKKPFIYFKITHFSNFECFKLKFKFSFIKILFPLVTVSSSPLGQSLQCMGISVSET